MLKSRVVHHSILACPTSAAGQTGKAQIEHNIYGSAAQAVA
jgi:hypothetical protein